jgi:hypothetical protein
MPKWYYNKNELKVNITFLSPHSAIAPAKLATAPLGAVDRGRYNLPSQLCWRYK